MKTFFLLLPVLLTMGSCQKFLDEKPDQKLAEPRSLADLDAILDADFVMNAQYPAGGEMASDNFYLTDADYGSLSDEASRAFYRWDRSVENELDWRNGYRQVFQANVVLEALPEISMTPSSEAQWNRLRGSALFFRAQAFFLLAQVYAPAYDPVAAAAVPGLPLRLEADITLPTTRASLEVTYEAIEQDLVEAASLLPAKVAIKTRPSQAAAYALLARVALVRRAFDRAETYASAALQGEGTLMDYNTLDPNRSTPFALFHPEVVFHATLGGGSSLSPAVYRIDSLLYRSYGENDLRRELFFTTNGDGHYTLKGSYSGLNNNVFFAGIATGEVYLMRAEARARLGRTSDAMDDLNTLLEKRWRTGAFTPFTAATASEALALIMTERRKELVARGGLRWMDLKRWNREGVMALSLQRVLAGQIYQLPPNDNRYTFLIPQVVIDASGIVQNE